MSQAAAETIERSTEGLREMLFQTLENFRAGKVDAAHVKAVTSLSNGILSTVAKDLEAMKLLEDSKNPNKAQGLDGLALNLRLGQQKDAVSEPKPTPSPIDSNAATETCIVDDVEVRTGDAITLQEAETGFGRLLQGTIRDHVNGVTRHKGSRY